MIAQTNAPATPAADKIVSKDAPGADKQTQAQTQDDAKPAPQPQPALAVKG